MAQSQSGPVFMSYSRRDEAVTRRIVDFLRNQGINVWVDNEKLIPGTSIWEEEIEKAIKSTGAVVVVMSPDSKNSEWVRREISLADQHRKRIFPVLVRGDEDTSITLRLITRQFVDIRTNEKAGLKSLSSALSVYLGLLSSEAPVIKGDTAKLPRERLETDAVQQTTIDRTGREEFSKARIETTRTPHNVSQAVLWFTLGWGTAGAIGGFIYNDYNTIAGGAIGGAIGGLVTLAVLHTDGVLSNQKNGSWIALAWALGGAIGWSVGWWLTEAIGASIGMGIFSMIGMVSTLGIEYIRANWKSIAIATLAWAIGGGIGWSIAKELIDGLSIDYAAGWTIGMAIGWGIGGLVMGWQMIKR